MSGLQTLFARRQERCLKFALKCVKQAGAELEQAQVKLEDIFEVVVEVVVKAGVKVEV